MEKKTKVTEYDFDNLKNWKDEELEKCKKYLDEQIEKAKKKRFSSIWGAFESLRWIVQGEMQERSKKRL